MYAMVLSNYMSQHKFRYTGTLIAKEADIYNVIQVKNSFSFPALLNIRMSSDQITAEQNCDLSFGELDVFCPLVCLVSSISVPRKLLSPHSFLRFTNKIHSEKFLYVS